MQVGGQYGESRILEMFFSDVMSGTVVDVGAADGYEHSNSYHLLQRHGWGGVLIEPDPFHYAELHKRYKDNPRVMTLNMGIAAEAGDGLLYCSGQASTFKPEWKKRAEEHQGSVYTGETLVSLERLDVVLSQLGIVDVDFLSIDCEGMDHEVMSTLDFCVIQPRLICLETDGYPFPDGYFEFCKTRGNTFYVRDY